MRGSAGNIKCCNKALKPTDVAQVPTVVKPTPAKKEKTITFHSKTSDVNSFKTDSGDEKQAPKPKGKGKKDNKKEEKKVEQAVKKPGEGLDDLLDGFDDDFEDYETYLSRAYDVFRGRKSKNIPKHRPSKNSKHDSSSLFNAQLDKQ